MAEQQQPIENGEAVTNVRGGEAESSLLGAAASAVTLSVLAAVSIVSRIWDGMTADGALAAAARQGVDELGAALKAFPDSIQANEIGTVFSPTQAEITNSREHGWDGGSRTVYSSLTPPPRADGESEQNVHGQQNDQDNGHRRGHSM